MTGHIQPDIRHVDNQSILYDASLAAPVTELWFSAAYWQDHATVERVGTGRGATWFIHTHDHDYVLRHYRRGGLVARLLRERYVWQGLDETRAWREWYLLADLYNRGLPVPQPVAARVIRHGLFYTADILMQRIADSVSLSALLQYRQLDAAVWQTIGRCIRRFHDQHINHADLNAHNILLTAADHVYLIDFDKGRIDMGRKWQTANLQRLQRSLNKLALAYQVFYFTPSDWEALLAGYAAGE